MITTTCCGVEIDDDHRFCPKCGYEARIAAALTRYEPGVREHNTGGEIWYERGMFPSPTGEWVRWLDVMKTRRG